MNLFWEVIKNNRRMIIFYAVLGIITSFLSLYSISYFQKILDSFGIGKLTLSMIIFYGILLIITTILSYIDTYPEQKLKNGLYLNFKLQSLKKMKTIDFSEYQKIGTGRLSQKVEDGSNAARDVIFEFYLRLIREIIPTLFFSLLFIVMIEPKIIFLLLGGYVIVILVTTVVLKKLYSLKEKILVNQELLNKHLIRGFMELVVFRTNKKYDTEIEVTKEGIKNIVDGKTRIRMVHEAFFAIFSLIVNLLKIAILIYVLITNNLTVGAVITLLLLIGKAYEPISIFNVIYIDYKLDKITLKKYIDFLSLPDDEFLNSGNNIKNIKGKIIFENVNFAYSSKNVIENLSLSIKEDSCIAFVGESGSGKSTIIKQIIGLIKPTEGDIYIDECNLKDLNLSSYYDHVSYVSQDSPIFDGTLKENIIFDKDISDEKILQVLKLVELEDFYLKLDDGLKTELGEKGVLMSGGERQRVAFARLFFDDSKIIILDEATSAMDNITENLVMKNVMKHLTNRTIIIIAHRLETIKDVDNIYVLEKGKIVESGKFDALLDKNGFFKRLYIANKKIL